MKESLGLCSILGKGSLYLCVIGLVILLISSFKVISELIGSSEIYMFNGIATGFVFLINTIFFVGLAMFIAKRLK